MAVICVLKRKGGVGASTLAVNLAGVWCARGRRVVLLDCDAQHSAAAWARFGEGEGGGVLASVVRELDTERPSEFRIELERAKRDADLVLVDAAPGFPVTALEAARHADVVLIPAGPSPLDLEPAADALEVAESCRDGRERPVIRFVPSKNLPRTRLGRDLPAALAGMGAEFGVGVLPSISQRVSVAEAVLVGQAVNEYEPGGEAAKEFAELADAVEALF